MIKISYFYSIERSSAYNLLINGRSRRLIRKYKLPLQGQKQISLRWGGHIQEIFVYHLEWNTGHQEPSARNQPKKVVLMQPEACKENM